MKFNNVSNVVLEKWDAYASEIFFHHFQLIFAEMSHDVYTMNQVGNAFKTSDTTNSVAVVPHRKYTWQRKRSIDNRQSRNRHSSHSHRKHTRHLTRESRRKKSLRSERRNDVQRVELEHNRRVERNYSRYRQGRKQDYYQCLSRNDRVSYHSNHRHYSHSLRYKRRSISWRRSGRRYSRSRSSRGRRRSSPKDKYRSIDYHHHRRRSGSTFDRWKRDEFRSNRKHKRRNSRSQSQYRETSRRRRYRSAPSSSFTESATDSDAD